MRTVTGNHKELIIIGQLVHRHVGVRGHDLLLGREFGALLEFKITNGTGQGKVAVDTAKVDETTRSANASLFACEGLAGEPVTPDAEDTDLRSEACGRMRAASRGP